MLSWSLSEDFTVGCLGEGSVLLGEHLGGQVERLASFHLVKCTTILQSHPMSVPSLIVFSYVLEKYWLLS